MPPQPGNVPTYFADINRYEYLDALRGLAAMAVMTRHSGDFWNFQIPRSYLAVDLFFLLSGFVIASAYDRKVASGQLNIWGFMKVRLIRLYPLFALSLLFSIVPFALNTVYSASPTLSIGNFALTVFFTACILPSRFTSSLGMFAINGPYWSLFFELVTNFFYVLIRPIMGRKGHVLLVLVTGAALAAGAILEDTLNFGFSISWHSYVAGFVRATFGIFFGLLLYQISDRKYRVLRYLKFPVVALPISISVFFIPIFTKNNGLLDILIVALLLPIIVLLAAKPGRSRVGFLLVGLGTISYALYVFHQPVAQLLEFFFPEFVKQYAPLTGVAFTLLLCCFALFIDKYFDRPIRRFLTKRFVPTIKPISDNSLNGIADINYTKVSSHLGHGTII